MNNIDIYTILQGRYRPNDFALMAEVSDKAGHSRTGSLDYVAVDLWPSRGLAIHGIELKRSRGDWLRELKNPAKQENHFKECNHFWLLTTDESIAKLEEIPITWGWLNIKGDRIYTKKEAPRLEPLQLSKHFAVAMLKRASDKSGWMLRDEIKSEIDAARKIGEDAGKNRRESLEKEINKLRTAVSDFERASGINLNSYHRWSTNPTKMGQIVKFIESGGASLLRDSLLKLEPHVEQMLANIKSHLANVPALEPLPEFGETKEEETNGAQDLG